MNQRENPEEPADKTTVERVSILPTEESVHTSVHTEAGWTTRHRRLIGITALVLVVVAALVYWLLHRKRAAAQGSDEAAVVVSVTVAKAERKTIAAQVSAVGTVFPHEQATVSSKVGAPIKQMALLKNRPVRAGEVIATLESKDLAAQRGEAAAALEQARASSRSLTSGTIPQTNAQDEKALRDARATAATARATFERRKILYDKGAISRKDLEASQLALTTAEDDLRLAERTTNLRATALNPSQRELAASQINQAQQHLGTVDAQLSYATIRAPISGIVTDQFQFQGEYAAPGAKLVNIANISEVTVKANFSDMVASQLKVGEPAKVVPTDAPTEEMNGQITLVSRSSDPLNRTVEIWVNLANDGGRLRAQGAALVTIATKQVEGAVVVPASAVTLDASNADAGTVMVVDALSVARETKVTVGIRSGDQLEIKSGLQGGEQVVTEGNYALPDGTRVQATEASKDNSGTNDAVKGEAGAGTDGAKGDEP